MTLSSIFIFANVFLEMEEDDKHVISPSSGGRELGMEHGDEEKEKEKSPVSKEEGLEEEEAEDFRKLSFRKRKISGEIWMEAGKRKRKNRSYTKK